MRKDPHQKDHSTRELMLKIKDNNKSFFFIVIFGIERHGMMNSVQRKTHSVN